MMKLKVIIGVAIFLVNLQLMSAEKKTLQKDQGSLNHLVLREKELDARELFVKKMEERLKDKEKEVLQRISELEKIKKYIAKKLESRVKEDRERVNQLISFYSNMQPEKAAKIIDQLDEGLAVQVLSGMKKKNVAEIMNLLPIDKARDLSEKFTGYRREKKSIK